MSNLPTIRTFSILVIMSIIVGLSVRALLSYSAFGSKTTLELTQNDVDLTLKNITYTKIREGESIWNLLAKSATQSQEDGVILASNVEVVFFDKKAGNIKLSADHGTLNYASKALTFRSNVVVTSPSGTTLLTDYLEYDEDSNIAQSNTLVKITMADFIVHGNGMLFDVEKRSLVLLSGVSAISRAMNTN